MPKILEWLRKVWSIVSGALQIWDWVVWGAAIIGGIGVLVWGFMAALGPWTILIAVWVPAGILFLRNQLAIRKMTCIPAIVPMVEGAGEQRRKKIAEQVYAIILEGESNEQWDDGRTRDWIARAESAISPLFNDETIDKFRETVRTTPSITDYLRRQKTVAWLRSAYHKFIYSD